MINKLPQNLTLEVIEHKITNVSTIITALSEIEDLNMLIEYYTFLSNNLDINLYENLSIILDAINVRINYLKEVKQKEETLNSYIGIETTLESVYPLIKKYLQNREIEYNDKLKVYSYLSNLIAILETGFAIDSSFELELLRTAINYIEEKEKNDIEENLLKRYNNYIENLDSSNKEMNKNAKSKTYTTIPKSPLLLDDEGISLSIIVITTTILLGALLAVLLLVK